MLSKTEFRELANVDDGHAGVFWSGEGGPSPWEMHPDCDERLQVLDREIKGKGIVDADSPGPFNRAGAATQSPWLATTLVSGPRL